MRLTAREVGKYRLLKMSNPLMKIYFIYADGQILTSGRYT